MNGTCASCAKNTVCKKYKKVKNEFKRCGIISPKTYNEISCCFEYQTKKEIFANKNGISLDDG